MKSKWAAFAVVIVASFAVSRGRYAHLREAPPIPSEVVTPDGQIVVTRDDIQSGQNVWQSMDGIDSARSGATAATSHPTGRQTAPSRLVLILDEWAHHEGPADRRARSRAPGGASRALDDARPTPRRGDQPIDHFRQARAFTANSATMPACSGMGDRITRFPVPGRRGTGASASAFIFWTAWARRPTGRTTPSIRATGRTSRSSRTARPAKPSSGPGEHHRPARGYRPDGVLARVAPRPRAAR